jgi:hypothetical protein
MRGRLDPSAPLRAALCFGVALSAFSFAVSPAWAQFYVRSPEVSKGELEIEEHGRPEWKAAGGVLFGVSDAVSDLTYKFDIEVEF